MASPDLSHPVEADRYDGGLAGTGWPGYLNANMGALATWLETDAANKPVGTKRVSGGEVQRWDGAAWQTLALNYLRSTGGSASAPISFPLGTAPLPSIYFATDTDTGFYSPGADQVAITTGGIRRLHVGAAGGISQGTPTPSSTYGYRQLLTLTGGTTGRGFQAENTFASDVTTSGVGYDTSITTAAATFTLAQMVHFRANQAAIGAGSTVTAQYGFLAQSSLTGAGLNFGFYANLTSATGRWNFYANGTAPSFFEGMLMVGQYDVVIPGITQSYGTMLGGTSAAKHNLLMVRFNADNNGVELFMAKSKSSTLGTFAAPASGDVLGRLRFMADDGASTFTEPARIEAQADGAMSSTSMPGLLRFMTTPVGAVLPIERARVDNAGNVLVNTTTSLYGLTGRGIVEINGTAAAAVGLKVASVGAGYLIAGATNVDLFASAGRILTFGANGAEGMRLDTAMNLGVGTAPGSGIRLHAKVTGASAVVQIENDINSDASFRAKTAIGYWGMGCGIGANANAFIVYDFNAGAQRMSIDSNGRIADGAGNELGYRGAPLVGYTGASSLALTDRGKTHFKNDATQVTVPAGVFTGGDVVSILNFSASNMTIIGTALAGVGGALMLSGTALSGNRTLLAYGVCTLIFLGPNHAMISGSVT